MTDSPLMRNQRNRDQWLSIAKFLQEQKPSPTFKRKPTASQQARALVAKIVAKGSQMAQHAVGQAERRTAAGSDICEPKNASSAINLGYDVNTAPISPAVPVGNTGTTSTGRVL